MAGIYTKGMVMPIRCVSCPLWKVMVLRSPALDICGATHRQIYKPYSSRPEWCPLIEVPAHGRLIDADALDIKRREEQAWHDYEQNPNNEYLEGVKDGLHEAAKQLSIAPTVIPAKAGNNG